MYAKKGYVLIDMLMALLLTAVCIMIAHMAAKTYQQVMQQEKEEDHAIIQEIFESTQGLHDD